MAATYPAVVRPFTTKINYVQDIDATHINDLQEEVVAIQSTFGNNPHWDVGLFTPGVITAYANVNQRIASAEKGGNHPFVSLTYGPSATNAWGTASQPITFTGELVDTHAQFGSGNTVTAARDGYYILSASVYMTAWSGGTIATNHAYLLRIYATVSGVETEVTASEVAYPANYDPDVKVNCTWQGRLLKNSTVQVHFLNASPVSRTMQKATFQMAFLRGL